MTPQTAWRSRGTLAWLSAHLVYPMLPFLLEGGIRIILLGLPLSLFTFNPATLCLSLGLMCLFVDQSLRQHTPVLPDQYESNSRMGTAAFFLTLAVVFFALFTVVVLLRTLVVDRGISSLAGTLAVSSSVAFVVASVPILSAVAAQRSFKLRVRV